MMARLFRYALGVVVLGFTVIGLIAMWEQVRGLDALSRFRRDGSLERAVLKEVTSLGRLELVRYTFKDIVEHQQPNLILPNSAALLIVEGEATGCIDLSHVQPADINLIHDTLTIRLPKPQLCSWKINHDRSRVYDTKFSFLNESQLISDAYRQAETQIRQAALSGGILDQTRQNANQMLRPLLERIANRPIRLTFE